MEIKDLVNTYGIIGVISNYKSTLDKSKKVKDLEIKNIKKALIMVGLNEKFLEKEINVLSISELWKVELASKLNNEVIIVGNMSSSLIKKDSEFMRKLFLKLNKEYNKKIVIIDEDITYFMNLVKYICVINNKRLIYQTKDFFAKELYRYTKMPKIVEFINYINKDKKRLNNTLDIEELIKDIFRSTS